MTLLNVNEHLKPWYIHSSKNFIVFFFSLETSVAETSFFVVFLLETTMYIYVYVVVEVDY